MSLSLAWRSVVALIYVAVELGERSVMAPSPKLGQALTGRCVLARRQRAAGLCCSIWT